MEREFFYFSLLLCSHLVKFSKCMGIQQNKAFLCAQSVWFVVHMVHNTLCTKKTGASINIRSMEYRYLPVVKKLATSTYR